MIAREKRLDTIARRVARRFKRGCGPFDDADAYAVALAAITRFAERRPEASARLLATVGRRAAVDRWRRVYGRDSDPRYMAWLRGVSLDRRLPEGESYASWRYARPMRPSVEDRIDAETVLEAMRPRERWAWTAHHWEGMTWGQVAERFEVTAGAVCQWMSAEIARLRARFNPETEVA